MATIVEKIAVCGFYASLYAHTERGSCTLSGDSVVTTESLRKKLDSSLPKLYAAVLVFSVKTREYFTANRKLTLDRIESDLCLMSTN